MRVQRRWAVLGWLWCIYFILCWGHKIQWLDCRNTETNGSKVGDLQSQGQAYLKCLTMVFFSGTHNFVVLKIRGFVVKMVLFRWNVFIFVSSMKQQFFFQNTLARVGDSFKQNFLCINQLYSLQKKWAFVKERGDVIYPSAMKTIRSFASKDGPAEEIIERYHCKGQKTYRATQL